MATKRKWHGRVRRQYRFRDHHFTVEEAKELRSLPRLDLYELRIMVRQRDKMWDEFDKDATAKGWGKRKRDTEWIKAVNDFYTDNDFVAKTEAQHVIKLGAWRFTDTIGWKNIWFWFDYVRSTLPIEKQYGRGHRAARYVTKKERQVKAEHEADKAAEQQKNEAGIRRLLQNAVNNPANDKRITAYAKGRYGFKNKSLLRTATAKGYRRQM